MPDTQPTTSPVGDLRGRVALVTGVGRKRGIGSAVCRALASRGADVAFSYWRDYDRETPWASEEDEPEALLGELRVVGVGAEGVEVDLSLPDSARLLLAYSSRDSFEDLDARTLDAHYAVNVRAMALLSVEFARRYPGGPGGRIVNFSSGQSLGPMPGELAYVATKGAIEAFTRTLAVEVGHKGITVNAVNPGPTDTGWMTEELEELIHKFPLGRIGQPGDIARLVAFLASEEAAWITGQIIHSEGGFFRS